MGLHAVKAPDDTALRDLRRERFGTYFPRVFAYAGSLTGDEATATEVVLEAFTRVFARSPYLSSDDFSAVLFGFARDLCRAVSAHRRRPPDGLSPRERDVIALVFDAQLSRQEIVAILGVKSESVASILLKGLRKLRESSPSRAAASLPGRT
ncbi:MAG: sigma-70 family RNA polymerase sigma factor [Dehalococcoidia bacterium]|nr:sigma-70 family RNA polymerase sigma factor [Dehalococcoidia bacterium]